MNTEYVSKRNGRSHSDTGLMRRFNSFSFKKKFNVVMQRIDWKGFVLDEPDNVWTSGC